LEKFINFLSDIEVESPGRINLIGEHIDYNGGFVLPAAIDKVIHFKFRKRKDNLIHVQSMAFDNPLKIEINKLDKSPISWHNYIIGVLYYINLICPDKIQGFDCVFKSNLPIGSGISSSAALECGFAKGVNELLKLKLSNEEIISLCQRAEHDFAGTKCGIMDQYAVINGLDNHFLLLNCQKITHKLVPAQLLNHEIVLLNTNVSHNLSTSEYNIRTQECQAALNSIQVKYPEYNFLCDIPIERVNEFKVNLPLNHYKRAVFTSEENHRTLKAVDFLKDGDLIQLGNLLYSSHEGLRDLYEVSCKELDFLVEFTRNISTVKGARMMGGGFGGCTLNIVKEDYVDFFINDISKAYLEKFNIKLTPHIIKTNHGVKVL
jgi:galactokinase